MAKIGFACKWIDFPHQVNGIKPKDDAKQYNTGSTTVAWLNRQTRSAAEDKLWQLAEQNTKSALRLVERVSELDEPLRMVRLSSDILPVYTEPSWSYFYRQPDVRSYLERAFAPIGELARSRQVRLSFHPGQFCVLASDNSDIVDRSIEEFEYHVDMARWMGYGRTFQDYKINIHISGRAGPEGMLKAYNRLSPEARNCITIENEEISHGLDTCLSIGHTIPVVLDVHHHWIHSGEYIQLEDSRIQQVLDSWRGVRPAMHYSVSREDLLDTSRYTAKPVMADLLAEGYKKQKLRAHSDFYWNDDVNKWVINFLNHFDIMCESKGKNLASMQLYMQAKEIGWFPEKR